MRIGVVILCRYGSKRLPGKILQEINGRTVIGHIVDRVKIGAKGYPTVVATSDNESDDPIAAYCRRAMLECFRGSLDDVFNRLLNCAEKYSWDYVVRINGDNLFADSDTLHTLLAVAETNVYDFLTNVPGRTFPFGMSVEIIRVTLLKKIQTQLQNPSDREHVTSWLYKNENVGRRYVLNNKICPEAAGMQLALDTKEDLCRYEKFFKRMKKNPATYGLSEIFNLAVKEVGHNPWKGKSGPLLIAEIGGNHEGNFDVARDLAQRAISTGVDYIKFQLYRGDTLVSPVESPDRNRHFKRFELTREQHIELAQMCLDKDVGYLASVWDLEMLDWIDPYLKLYKIGSGDLTAWTILQEFARRGKPIILSTGLATLDEVLQTVTQIQAIDQRYTLPDWLCLLQCTSMYPIADKDANLRVMNSLQDATGLAVGYSDHTEGGMALRAAAAMGAEVLEFHFTDNREGKTFRDHKVSLTPEEVILLRKDVQQITELRGDNVKVPQLTEFEQGHVVSFRRGVYPTHNIKAGEVLKADNFYFMRPNHGIDARDFEEILEKKSKVDLLPFKAIQFSDFN